MKLKNKPEFCPSKVVDGFTFVSNETKSSICYTVTKKRNQGVFFVGRMFGRF